MTAATPGPWTISQPWSGFSQITGGDGKLIFGLAAGSNDEKRPDKECDANARLIESAPAMYAALKELLDYTINRLYGGDYPMGTNPELDAPIATLALVDDEPPEREEYPDNGPTDPSETSGPGRKP